LPNQSSAPDAASSLSRQKQKEKSMTWSLSRRELLMSAAATAAAPALLARTAAGAEPLLLRCSLETPPSHARNAVIRDYLKRIEAATNGRIRTQLFESGQLFPDLQAGKALLQGQIEMAVPGTFSLTGIVSDADFFQLPVLYGRSIEVVHGVVDGAPGQLLARQIEQRLSAHVIGPWLDLGFFNWFSTSRALRIYDDLRGLKIRNSGGAGQAWRTAFMGAIPNTTPLPNVPLGLSQGTFDGLVTTHETVASGQFWESGIRYAFEDHQFLGEYIPIVSRAFWQKLPVEFQQLLTDLWRTKVAAYRSDMAAAQFRARELVQAHGVAIVVPSAEQLAFKRREMMAHQDQVAKLSKISPEMIAAVSTEIPAG
jgi:TRAP-type C4-dicarboxylate transport system substrate-binding protein